jgi:hypothetical protein
MRGHGGCAESSARAVAAWGVRVWAVWVLRCVLFRVSVRLGHGLGGRGECDGGTGGGVRGGGAGAVTRRQAGRRGDR